MISHYLGTVLSLYADVAPARDRDPPLSRSVTDADGREIRLRADDDNAFEPLVAMYAAFDPSQRAQGTPPRGESAIREWLKSDPDRVSVVAWHGERAVGHVALAPDGGGRHELAVFVHQDYQRAGIGSELLRAGLEHAARRGVTDVWLTVESRRDGVQNLYRDAGFTVDDSRGLTRRMSLSL